MCLVSYILPASRTSYLIFYHFWRASYLRGFCFWRNLCLTCSRSWHVSCLTCCGASRTSCSTCSRGLSTLYLTCFVPHLSHVTFVLRALMSHLSGTLSALVHSMPHLLQVFHAQQSSCNSCLVAFVSRTCLLCFWYYSYLRFFPTWATINHDEKQPLLKESCYNYFLQEI